MPPNSRGLQGLGQTPYNGDVVSWTLESLTLQPWEEEVGMPTLPRVPPDGHSWLLREASPHQKDLALALKNWIALNYPNPQSKVELSAFSG